MLINDMAEVNIDTELVRQGGGLVQQRDAALVELSNGCICCTLREDLLEEVRRLASSGNFDRLLIESTVKSHWRRASPCAGREGTSSIGWSPAWTFRWARADFRC